MTYGNGYPINEDHYARMDQTKPVGEARDPFFQEMNGRVAVVSIVEYNKNDGKGPVARVTCEILTTTNPQAHPVGSRAVKLYYLTKPSKFASQTTDADRFADFVRKLKNAPVGHPIGGDIRDILRTRAAEQLCRGMVIDVNAVNTSKTPGKPWVEPFWNSVQQTPEDIANQRRRMESTPGLIPSDRPQQAAAPAPQGYAAQPPMANPPHNPYGHQAPQGYTPQPYAQGPGPWPQAPQQGYTQAPPQPQPAPPAPMPQGYGAPAPQQAAPQGGYLQQLPPPPGGRSPY